MFQLFRFVSFKRKHLPSQWFNKNFRAILMIAQHTTYNNNNKNNEKAEAFEKLERMFRYNIMNCRATKPSNQSASKAKQCYSIQGAHCQCRTFAFQWLTTNISVRHFRAPFLPLFPLPKSNSKNWEKWLQFCISMDVNLLGNGKWFSDSNGQNVDLFKLSIFLDQTEFGQLLLLPPHHPLA